MFWGLDHSCLGAICGIWGLPQSPPFSGQTDRRTDERTPDGHITLSAIDVANIRPMTHGAYRLAVSYVATQ